jgi:F-type H+-transporting ATPase subunit a
MYNNLLLQYINATYYINFNKSPKYPYVLLNDTNKDFNISPLDQFEIKNFINLDISLINNIQLSLTNIGLYLTISAFIIVILNSIAINYDKLVSNNWSISQESLYATIFNIVINQINKTTGQIYFPFIFVLFIFILINNLIGMVPYSFASTSHFILTFSLSFTIVLGATLLGFQIHGLKFFSLFVPSGCPLGLLPLLVLIEFISYLARNISLGLRLAANILSGHMLLNILAGFTYNIMNSGFIYLFLGLIPLAFILAFSGLELGIAFIQAQVFVVLSSSYIKDGLDLH